MKNDDNLGDVIASFLLVALVSAVVWLLIRTTKP